MSQQQKFDFSVSQVGDQWNAEVTRRVSSRKTSVTKQKKGFASEAQATEWAEAKLAECVENLQAGNQRKADKRHARTELATKQASEKALATELYNKKQQAYFESLDDEDFDEDDSYDEDYEDDLETR
ncbi:DUF3622 domain-containing protein [Psychromonas sp. KJ10-10]|uniref:DUF3622 domain-containing protein n=1 Tax=Psychromonas sp. KJ10-10 TaxID=3391823 RepID=UPI0039B459E0